MVDPCFWSIAHSLPSMSVSREALYSDSLDGACLLMLTGRIRDCNAVALRSVYLTVQ